VTGSLGYVGTATTELFENNNYKVLSIDKKNGKDVRNIISFFIFAFRKPKVIIHLSAKKSVPESIKNPISYYLNNILSTLVVGIVSRVLSIPVVFASSAAVYNPNNPYAKAKVIEENILKFFCNKLVILRYFNIIGKTKTVQDKLSTNIFSIISRESNIKINSLESTRDYVHVLDIAKANLLAFEYLKFNSFLVTDIFTGNQKSIENIIKEYESFGKKINYKVLGIDDYSVNSKIDNRDKLGWFPDHTFSDGVRSEIIFN